MKSRKHFSHRLLLFICPATSAILLASLLFSGYRMYQNLMHATFSNIRSDLQLAAGQVQDSQALTLEALHAVSSAQENGLFGEREGTVRYLQDLASRNPAFSRVYVVYESETDGGTEIFSAGWSRKDGELIQAPPVDLEAGDSYQRVKACYTLAKVKQETLTEPHGEGEAMMVELTYPIIITNTFAGIAGVDRALHVMAGDMARFLQYESEELLLVTRRKNVVVSTGHPEHQTKNCTELPMAEAVNAAIRTNDVFQLHRDPDTGEAYYAMATYLPSCEWFLIIRVAQSEVLTPVIRDLATQAGVSFGFLAVMLIILSLILKVSLRPVLYATQAAEQVSQGDLTVKITSKREDELGCLLRSIQQMTDNLNSVVCQVQRIGLHLASSTVQMFSSTRELETTVTEQAQFTQEVLGKADAIAESAQTLAQLVDEVQGKVSETEQTASSSSVLIDNLGASVQRLQDATGNIAGKLTRINDSANAIEGIVETIDSVSGRTNLLSLNAAIEAEKAGEHGRGFSVVAREIQRLADQTAISATRIRSLIAEMQSAVSSGVMEIEKFTSEVRTGVASATESSRRLACIAGDVQQLAPQFEYTGERMQAQSESARQISAGVRKLME
ncbi:MAG: methyl-accepting chemotaxis protein, partial [Kiritimatiellae bacterium]|nr:methyl-accepting chemotaxis protein [Kiritimatiellia bacterium]